MFIQISWSRIGKPYNYAEFLCETDSDVAALPTQKGKCAVGSKAFVLSSSKTYILNNNNQWVVYKSEIPDVSDFITKDVSNLTYYTLKTSTGSLIDLEINSSTYVVTLKLKDIDGNVISTDTIDLPLETVVVGGRYDNPTKKVILILENGSTVEFSVADLVTGLQSEITSTNKLASDLVDDTNSGNKFVTTSEKQTWNAKGTYSKPSGGIPKTDLTSAVQTSLDKADNALPASRMVTLTQAQYDALETKDSDTYYHIPEEE